MIYLKITAEEKINLISKIYESLIAKQISDKIKDTLKKGLTELKKVLVTFFTMEELKKIHFSK